MERTTMNPSVNTPVPYLSEITRLLAHFDKTLRPAKRPKFKVLMYAPEPNTDPFQETGIDGDDRFVGFTIMRNMKEVEVIAEVKHCGGQGVCWLHAGDVNTGCEENHTTGDCIEIGDCFNLYGEQKILSLEEEEEARKTWIANQEYRAAKERD
jgi:hypothetical protein